MKRLFAGAALGGLAVYLYDPALGNQRRERLSSLWRDRQNAVQASLAASQVVVAARPLARSMTEAVGRGDWTKAFSRPRRAGSLTTLIGAAAIGGVLVFFLDPSKGSERRQRLLTALQAKQHSTLEAGRQVARQTATTVKPVVSRAGDQVASVVEGVKSQVRSVTDKVTDSPAQVGVSEVQSK
jgi:hypothetical protein